MLFRKKVQLIKIEVKKFMGINYATLKSYLENSTDTELQAALAIGAANTAADIMNRVRVGNTVNTGIIPANEFVKVFDVSEYAQLSNGQQAYLQLLSSAGTIFINDTQVIANISALFGAGTTTRANFIAAQQRDGSWGETLFGIGTYITDSDISQALQS